MRWLVALLALGDLRSGVPIDPGDSQVFLPCDGQAGGGGGSVGRIVARGTLASDGVITPAPAIVAR